MARDEPAASITEIQFDHPLGRSAIEISIIVAGLISAVAFLMVVTIVARLPRSAFAMLVAVGAVLVVGAMILFHQARRRGVQRVVERILGPTDRGVPDVGATTRAVLPHIRGKQYRHGLEALARGLALRGAGGATLRIAAAPAGPIEPLVVPFEPQPLDETLSGLMRAGGGDDPPGPGGAASPPASRARPLAGVVPAGLHRNIILKGGWVLVIIFAVNWALAALDAWRHRRWLHPTFVLWSLGLAAMIFIPVGARLTSSRQWFLVPGGLLLRSAGWRQRGWTLHVFERSRSVLCLCRSRRNQGWAVSVSDGRESGTTLATPYECEFLLRAWLSPLPPPPLEKLGDLV